MDLTQYGQIIWKRIWIPALLFVVVAAASLLTLQVPPSSYSTSMRFTVRVQSDTGAAEYDYDGYYGWLASEYMTDDLSAIVRSQAFAADVNRYLAEMENGTQIPPGVLSGVTFGEKQHRVLQVNLTWGEAGQLTSIAQAVVLAMENDAARYLDPLGGPETTIQVIDPPSPPAANPPSLTQQLQLPVRLLLALGVGLALTFLLDYLDTSVRGRAELEAMGISVLAEVPKK